MPLSTAIMINIMLYTALIMFLGWWAVPLIILNHVVGYYMGKHGMPRYAYKSVNVICLK